MTKDDFWNNFIQENPSYRDRTFLAFGYWGLTDRLAEMVVERKKQMSISSYQSYIFYKEEMPKEGDVFMILDSDDEPVCIIENREVKVIKFHELDESYSHMIGQNSFVLWKKVQENYFRKECENFGIPFDPDDFPVILEIFDLKFTNEEKQR
ncbi:ASCH domain-containing protein [Guggenheimella bovis]